MPYPVFALFALLATLNLVHLPLTADQVAKAAFGIAVFGFLSAAYSLIHQRRKQKKIAENTERLHHATRLLRADLERQTLRHQEIAADLRSDLVRLEDAADSDGASNGTAVMAELKILQSQLSALHRMSGRPSPPPTGTQDGNDAGVPQTATSDTRLKILRQALIDDRVALYMQPIVALDDDKPQYFEAYSRLHLADGTVLLPEAFIAEAEQAGLMAIIDNLLLFRCVQKLRQLRGDQPDIRVFVNISSASIADAEFFPQFVAIMANNSALSRHIVFEFSQQDILYNWAPLQAATDRLVKLGFRFSMDKINHLDMDFADLAKKHIHFIKAPLRVLDQSAATRPSRFDGRDLKDVLARLEMELIVTDIETETDRRDVPYYHASYAQGYFLGNPEPSKIAA